MGRSVQIVWFKRDLRVVDHAPLAQAARAGPVLPLYLVEPGLWREPDASGRQWAFVRESLVELRDTLARLGAPLVVRAGEAVAVLEELRGRLPVGGLWAHEETGNFWTFERDRRVRAWARSHGIPLRELRQSGVIRGLRDRTGWSRRWDAFMRRPIVPSPERIEPVPAIEPGPIPELPPGLSADPCPGRQRGGRSEALALLASFLDERCLPYQRAMSSPEAGAVHCSRLSPHLAFGTVSIREVLQRAEAALGALDGQREPEARKKAGALRSFVGRLHWRCHFVQKLEDEPEIERRPFHPFFEGVRGLDPDRFRAWAEGRTGWPYLDACMRALAATGWLNFRARSMLMAVSSYQLWQDWREPGLHLARLFTDYEPGIHWPQVQMQSGTTGINTLRVYDPTKQGLDHDPDGRFVACWVPELARLPTPHRLAPWRAPPLVLADAGIRLGIDYPLPLVDAARAAAEARARLWAIRRLPGFSERADAIQDKHGSRKAGVPRPDRRPPRPPGRSGQLRLDL
ncbi:MAG: FAD-binding domain-containing protein [Geminicoccaceae bacterium]|nr:FAD-binding domain-containing protein [Geminicoccaceae bacterium]